MSESTKRMVIPNKPVMTWKDRRIEHLTLKLREARAYIRVLKQMPQYLVWAREYTIKKQGIRIGNSIRRERKALKEKKIAIKAREELERAVGYMVKDNPSSNQALHLEIVIRTIIAYQKLIMDGLLAYSEFIILLTAAQLEFFTVEDVINRFGEVRYIKRDFKSVLDAGFITKVPRKNLFNITIPGKDRLNSILTFMYEQKGTGYAIHKKKARNKMSITNESEEQ